MKRIIVSGIVSISLLYYTHCQDKNYRVDKVYPVEKLMVHLSQKCLFPGEVLWFKIYGTSPLYPEYELSSMAYIELVNSDNAALIREKILLNKGTGNGEFIIPEDIQTGIYYIMAYTNWMKNFGEACFFKTNISIINPEEKFDYTEENDIITGLPVKEQKCENNIKKLQVTPDKKEYTLREKVTVKIETGEQSDSLSRDNFSIAVFRKEPYLLAEDKFQNRHDILAQPQKINYLPDYKGVKLTGNITDDSGTPLSGEPVVLSFPGSGIDISSAVTDNKGDFHFLLKQKEGVQDMVFILPKPNLKLTLEETFWNGFREPLTNSGLKLNEEAISYLKERYSHFQLQKKFGQHNFEMKNLQETFQAGNWIFYGKPRHIVEMDEYIKLDSLTEYFWELIPSTKFVRKKGKFIISITDPRTLMPFEDAPGVFIDGVLYPDYDEIAGIPVEEARQIAILDETYYYKDFTFGGIVDIHTKKNDFSSVRILPEMIRVMYPLGSVAEAGYSTPDYSDNNPQSNIPDLRYLICWKPDISIKNTGEATIEFYTCDIEGEYVISVVGISNDGKITKCENEIVVRANLKSANN